MPIYKINKTKAVQISLKEDGFGSEAELRDFFAENLDEILTESYFNCSRF